MHEVMLRILLKNKAVSSIYFYVLDKEFVIHTCNDLCYDLPDVFNSELELHPKKLPVENVTPESE